jgi:hypothetical protein
MSASIIAQNGQANARELQYPITPSGPIVRSVRLLTYISDDIESA